MSDAILVAEDKPEFDFSELSWGDSMDFSVVQAKVNGLTQNPLADPAEVKKTFDQLNSFLALIVVHIPRAWLVKRAPDVLDFTQADTFRHLKQTRVQDLMQAMNESQSAEKKS